VSDDVTKLDTTVRGSLAVLNVPPHHEMRAEWNRGYEAGQRDALESFIKTIQQIKDDRR
jgi:hypothetical protein